MSAIAGLWVRRGEPEPGECERMLGAHYLRTADCVRTWRGDGLALGRKLVPLVPEDRFDEQPVGGPESRYVVVADLRIDNRSELARELSIDSGRLQKMSDAQLAALCLEYWHEAAFDRLIGVFAIAAWDTRERRLLLSRDFSGGRPLFYHKGENLFAFASMPSGLHALPSVPRGVDYEAMAETLALLWSESTRSAYAGVERVMPGHYCVVDSNGVVRQSLYWRPNLQSLRFRRHEEYVEGLRYHLDQAVASQLRGADGHVGAHLSAGFDSSAVATSAALQLQAGGGKVTAFTASPREGFASRAESDEAPVAAATAAMHPNMEHVIVRCPERSALDNLDRSSTIYGGPLFNLTNAVWIDAINDATRSRGLKVLLVGAMGNATLSYGGGAALAELFATGRYAEWFRLVKALRRQRNTRWRGAIWNTAAPWAPGRAAGAFWRLIGRGGPDLARYTSLRPSLLRRIYQRVGADRRQWRGIARQSLDVWDRPHRSGQAARLAMFAADLGPVNKGVLGWWGVDMRDPTSDRRLVEFSLRIPTEAFIHDGAPKALIRSALKDRVAAEVLNPRARGFQSADWHEDLTRVRDRLREEVERIELLPQARELIDVERLRNLVANWPSGGWDSMEVRADYRLSLLRAVSVANFIQRASGSNY